MFFKNYFRAKKEARAFEDAKDAYAELSKNYFKPEEVNTINRDDLVKIIKGEVQNSFKLENPYSKSGPNYLLFSHSILRHINDYDDVRKFSGDDLNLFDHSDWFGLIDTMPSFNDSIIIPGAIEFEIFNKEPVLLGEDNYLGHLHLRQIKGNIFGHQRGDYQLDKLWGTKLLFSTISVEELVDVFKEVYSGTKYESQLNKIQ